MANVSHIDIDGTVYDITPASPVSVGNGTLTIQKNGSNVQTFTANQSSNATANITVPTKTSDLTNDSGYITDAGVTGVKGNSETNYRTGNVNITKTNIGLENVPNVTTNNQAPTFTQASTRANIASGETLTVILGKIMKFFADLKTVAFSGSYTDLSDKPTIPTVNNGTLTIQKNGTNVKTFTANQSSNVTANITVPTKTSELTNDSGYITNAGVTGVKGNNETNYRTGNVNITKANIGLGNVPNVATNDQTPTFTQASTRANISSGETLAVILGKIMKFFADLKTVAFSGSYTDLSNKPTIPTVNNGTLTIQKNGTNVQTFTANQSSNVTANITVPTTTSALTNNSGFKGITSYGVSKSSSHTSSNTPVLYIIQIDALQQDYSAPVITSYGGTFNILLNNTRSTVTISSNMKTITNNSTTYGLLVTEFY